MSDKWMTTNEELKHRILLVDDEYARKKLLVLCSAHDLLMSAPPSVRYPARVSKYELRKAGHTLEKMMRSGLHFMEEK